MNLVVQTLLGIVGLLVGVVLLYFFMSGLGKGPNFIFLALSLVFIGAGAFLFIRISKLQNAIQEGTESVTETGSKLLDKNNKMIQSWDKTNSRKESLKAIEMAAAAQAQATKEKM